MLAWKRKGGRATAQHGRMQFVVEDDGRYRFLTVAGEWRHGRATDAAEAKDICAGAAENNGALAADAARALAARRLEAEVVQVKRRVVTPEERQWADGVGRIMAICVYHPELRAYAVEDLRSTHGGMRVLVEAWLADAAVMAGLARIGDESKVARHVADSIVESLAEHRLESGKASDAWTNRNHGEACDG